MKIRHGFRPPGGRGDLDPAVAVDLGAQVAEGVEVRVEAAAADHVAARRRHPRLAEAGEQRAGEQERGADPGRERLVRSRSSVTASACRRSSFVAGPLGLHARAPRARATWVSVSRIRGTLREHHLLLGEQAGGEDRQRGVLVAGGDDLAREGRAPLDHELLHRRG